MGLVYLGDEKAGFIKKKIQFNNHPTWRLVVTRGGNLIWQRVKGNK